jgi:hypothetical protein
MNRTFVTFLKLTGWAIVGILAIVGLVTLLSMYFDAHKEVPVGVSPHSSSAVEDTSQTEPKALTGSIIQFDAPMPVWGTRNLVVPIGLPNRHYSSELKRRAGLWDDNLLVNAAVVNENTEQVVLVFDRALAIGRIDAPRDSSQRRRQLIIYTSFIADSDSNGVINASDNAVLFTSALDGTGCQQITPDTLSVLDYVFVDRDTRLRIKLAHRSRDKAVKAEDWEHVMLWYDFGKRMLSSNHNLDAAIAQVKKTFRM